MRRLRWSVVVLPLLLALPAGASAGPKDACHGAAAKPGAKVLSHSRAAVVFARKGAFYGCAYATAKVHKLDTCCDDTTFRVAGVWAGYAAAGSAIGDEFTKLGVLDLRTGRPRAIRKLEPLGEGAGREIDTAAIVTQWRLSGSGGLAWIQAVRHEDGTLGPEQQLRSAAGTRHPWERVVDTSLAIAQLRLREGRLQWTNQGVARATPLDDGPYRGRCDTVTGTPVLQTDAVRIVKVPRHVRGGGTEFVGSTFLGCALPSGAVHDLGAAGTTYLYDNGRREGVDEADTLRLTKPAGTYVLRTTSSGANTFTIEAGDVVDLVSGVANGFMYYFDDQSGDPQDDALPSSEPLSTVLSPTGVFGGVFDTDASEHLVMGLTPLGARRDLDTAPAASIPPSSLAVDGATVSWTNAGAPKTAAVGD